MELQEHARVANELQAATLAYQLEVGQPCALAPALHERRTVLPSRTGLPVLLGRLADGQCSCICIWGPAA